jgi:hypothetical protein
MEAVFYALLILFVLAEVFISVRYVRTGQSKSLKDVLVPAGLFAVYLLALCIFRISIPYLVLAFATVTVFLHTFVGLYLKLYRKSKVYDRYLHGFGSFSFALLLYLTLSKVTVPGGSVVFRAVFVAAIGIASGAVFEIVEFVHDLRNKTNMQRGLKDTNLDLIFDVIGSAAAAILAAFVYL